MSFSVRRANAHDVEAIGRIQGNSSWHPATYLEYDLFVAEASSQVIGFIATRTTAGEAEILNIVVDPAWRRQGVASVLLQTIKAKEIFLEVRESNKAARQLYKKLGFTEYGHRREYYEDPREDAVLMKL